MKREYDFSRAKRGAIVPSAKGKTRITIRIDDEVLDWFRARVHEQGGGNYQTLMNGALREHMARNEDVLAETLRRIIREEVAPYVATRRRRASKVR
jgi:BrnA antitoxin of type II toxin-antitoxin system